MKIKVYFTTAILFCAMLFCMTLSQPEAGDKRMGPKSMRNIVDVHAHLHAPDIFDAIESITGEKAGFGWLLLSNQTDTYMQTFNIEERLTWMDQFGIKKAVFNFPSAYLYMRDEQTQKEERKAISKFINNYFAGLHQQYPERAFFMANVALSIGDVAFSKEELRRAIEDLGLHGVCIPTNIGGKALSDPEFEPFFAEVERLGVPIVTHPESPYCIEKLMDYGLFGRVGFPNDEALMVANMIYSGFLDNHPNLKIILTHLGGSLPYFYSRLDLLPEFPNLQKRPSEYLKDFYYDTAIGNPEALEFLMKFLGSADRIFFGTDHPYVDSAESNTIAYMNDTSLSENERKKICFKNAESLFGIE